MTDIVERLKRRAEFFSFGSQQAKTPALLAEAADEITRLRAVNEMMRLAMGDRAARFLVGSGLANGQQSTEGDV